MEHEALTNRDEDAELVDCPACTTPFENLPWDVTEHVFLFLEQSDVATLACVSKVHYALSHSHLWRKPSLSLTQAMLFTRFVYRRPVVTNALPPSIGDVVQKARSACVVSVNLRLQNEPSYMLEIGLDSVVRRIIGFCPQVTFEIELRKADESYWLAMLTELEKSKIKLRLHEPLEKQEDGAT